MWNIFQEKDLEDIIYLFYLLCQKKGEVGKPIAGVVTSLYKAVTTSKIYGVSIEYDTVGNLVNAVDKLSKTVSEDNISTGIGIGLDEAHKQLAESISQKEPVLLVLDGDLL